MICITIYSPSSLLPACTSHACVLLWPSYYLYLIQSYTYKYYSLGRGEPKQSRGGAITATKLVPGITNFVCCFGSRGAFWGEGGPNLAWQVSFLFVYAYICLCIRYSIHSVHDWSKWTFSSLLTKTQWQQCGLLNKSHTTTTNTVKLLYSDITGTQLAVLSCMERWS